MNIYQIKQELINIFDELEENGGELTDELAEKLAITQDNFKAKVEDYSKVIQMLNIDLESIKQEKKRLTDFAARKQKALDRITGVLIQAIEEFGDKKPSGVPYVDYGTGEISIRRSVAVEVDNSVLSDIERGVNSFITDYKNNRQLDTLSQINPNELLEYIKSNPEANQNLVPNDVSYATINLNVKIPVADLIQGNALNTLKEAVKYTSAFSIKSDAAKADLKPQLQADGSCAPNLARLVENKTLQIK